MELLYYYILLIILIFFINYIYKKYLNRRTNTTVFPINTFNLNEMENLINTYELVSQENIICPITQENILIGEDVKQLPCGHKFSIFIKDWLRLKNECPVCRENILNVV